MSAVTAIEPRHTDSTASALLEVRGMTKTYGDQRALDDVSFDVRRGEILGLIGPNGSGKTSVDVHPARRVARIPGIVRRRLIIFRQCRRRRVAVQQRLIDLAQELPPRQEQTPEALGALQKTEIEKWWPIIKAAGIKAD